MRIFAFCFQRVFAVKFTVFFPGLIEYITQLCGLTQPFSQPLSLFFRKFSVFYCFSHL